MFESITIDKERAAAWGLKPVKLDRLGRRVAITGPNGAGKTRLLNLLAEQIQDEQEEFRRLSILVTKKGFDAFEYYNAVCSGAESSLFDPETEVPGDARSGNLASMKRMMSSYRPQHSDWRDFFRTGTWPRVVLLSLGSKDKRRSRTFKTARVPTEKDLRTFPRATLDEFARALYLAMHPTWPHENSALIEQARKFEVTVGAMLGASFGAVAQGTAIFATLNGRKVEENDLSEGQRLLLRWAQIIHSEVDDIRGAIVLIDEPELHLHPSALIDTMKRLEQLAPAQLGVATHSVPLLAWIGPKQIYAMNQGTARWAGNDIEATLRGLLGDRDGTERLQIFLADAGCIAFHQFAAESLLDPGVADLSPDGDPQAEGFVTRIGELLATADESKVRVLEYSAGRGRLIKALANTPVGDRARLQYFAYNNPDHTPKPDAESCKRELQRLYEGAIGSAGKLARRYCEDLRAHSLDAAEKHHAVVLCNVLHEIPPSEWPTLMATLAQVLRPDGKLLILEDQHMSVGELPHAKGFLVLDEIELRALFGLGPESPRLRYKTVQDGRLSVAEISVSAVRGCSTEGVDAALKQLQTRALAEIKSLRRPHPNSELANHRRGRLHAYYALLHTNATLARLGPEPS